MKVITKEDRESWRVLTVRVVQLKADLMRAGLVQTGHAMEPVTQKVGWEIAEYLERGTVPALEGRVPS
jgi:hypothetical protein